MQLKLDEAERGVIRKIERSNREQIAFLTKLIRVKSFPGTKEEGEAQEIFRDKLSEIKQVAVDVWEPDLDEINRYSFHPIRELKDHWNYAGRPNVVGVLDGQSRRSLILNGHIDVVSPEPRSAWTEDPWTGKRTRDKLYGRGANDMKAGLSCILFAAKGILESGLRPKGRLIIESVVEEEFGGGGTISTLLKGYTASAALIAEPSGSRNVCIGSGGSRFFRVRVMGRSETPQSSHHGVNSIDPAYKIYRALTRLNQSRQRRLHGKLPNFERSGEGAMFGNGKATNLIVGKLKAGDFPATVAGWAEMEGRLGFPSGEDGKGVRDELEKTVRNEAKKDAWMRKNPPTVEWFNAQREPYELTNSEPIVNEVCQCVRDVSGTEPITFATPSSADCVFFANTVGRLGGIPTVMYGPGGKNAHAADEFVYLQDLVECTKVIALLIMRWCGYTQAD